MVTSNLLGGLGNYMFQITTAYSVAWDNNDKAIFNINDSHKVHRHLRTYLKNILRNIEFVQTPLPIQHTHGEPHFHYHPITYNSNLKLHGYYQSEKYFIHHKKEILDLYAIDDESRGYIEKKYGELLKNKTCSLHIRRGDFMGLKDIHPTCTLEYYNAAIKEIGDEVTYIIFSDDINWCKKNFKSLEDSTNIVYVEDNPDFIEMYLMSMCNNNIIANSSFSWWGAWLNVNPHKKVIAPINWFGPANAHLNTTDLTPKEWTLI